MDISKQRAADAEMYTEIIFSKRNRRFLKAHIYTIESSINKQ